MRQHTQRMSALEAANAKRTAIAVLKRDVKQNKLDPRDLLTEDPPRYEIEKIAVVDFLTWCPYIGDAKAKRIVRGVVNSQTLMIKDLSPATRVLVVARLHEFITSKHRKKATIGRIGYVPQAVPEAALA